MADSTLGFEFEWRTGGYLGGSEADPSVAEAHDTEHLLVDALRQGSEAAYEALIARYEQPVYSLVYRLMSDPDSACDVVQEVFIKIFRNIGKFKGKSSLKTWVYRIALNEAYNHRRWFSRHKKQEVGLETEDESAVSYQEILPDPGLSAFDLALGNETHAIIEAALGDVRPAFRAAVVLRDIEGLSYEEIAEILQVSLGTVKSRILRGREALRKSFESRLQPASALPLNVQPAQVK